MTILSWMPVNVGIVGTAYGGVEGNAALWINDFYEKLGTLNLIQTADTGQYVFGTLQSPQYAVNGRANLAYRMYRFEDSLATTLPIYIRITIFRYGSPVGAANGSFHGFEVTVGSSVNGTGGFIGPSQTFTTCLRSTSTSTASHVTPAITGQVAYQSYALTNADKGAFGLVFNPGQKPIRAGATDSTAVLSDLSFYIERIPNPDGTASAEGFTIWGRDHLPTWLNDFASLTNDAKNTQDTNIVQGVTILANGTKYTTTYGCPVFPQTYIQNEYLVNNFYHSVPEPVRCSGLVAIAPSRVNGGVQFEAVAYGALPTNYIVLPDTSRLRGSSTPLTLAMLWE